MQKWMRANYQPNKPLYKNRNKVTASPEHLELSRKAAAEGMVLLKNEGNLLPLPSHSRVALLGKGIFDYVKGGGGSGDVTVSHVLNLYDGCKHYKEEISIYEPLCDYYRSYVRRQYERGALAGLMKEAAVPEDLLREAKAFTDTAIVVISRFSGEAWDRKAVYYEGQEESEKIQSKQSQDIFGESDYYLTEEEQQLVTKTCENFPKVIVLLNTGAVMDSSWFVNDASISSVVLAGQGGLEGGLAMADILLGKQSPCGKLVDTWASDLEAYPSTQGFHESPMFVHYYEDIYVGYRYFETLKGASKKVNYPFGFGLTYTTFSTEAFSAVIQENTLFVTAKVKNIGARTAKEVLQLYVEAPQGLLGKPKKELVAFAKTGELKAGQEEILTLCVFLDDMASYDDLGKISKSAYVLEKGKYQFHLGTSVRDTKELDFSWELAQDKIIRQLSQKCPPRELSKRMKADGTYEELPMLEPYPYLENALGWDEVALMAAAPEVCANQRRLLDEKPEGILFTEVANGTVSLEDFMAQLSDLELIRLLGGQPNTGVANTYGWGNIPKYQVPNLMTTDGPAGVRILPQCEVYTTAWPVATHLASTWNLDLMQEVGRAIAEEVKENNLYVFLAPGVNIHRNPLCGRNFEYYSEDPFLAGHLGASLIKGVQSLNIGATVKHFCCNNKETNRRDSDSRVSERALREIYLKAFEIIIKESNPWALMSSYNRINGCRASEHRDLLTGILREEWGYEGVVTSDWFTFGEHYKELLAGNDVKMGCGYPERLQKALEMGLISRKDLEPSAKRVLQLILKAD